MQNWYENSFDKISVVEQRLIEMRTLLGRFRKMIQYKDEVYVRVTRVKQFKITGQPACVSPAHILGKIIELGLVETAIKSYEDSSKKCWNHSKLLVNGLMCAVCDANNQDQFISDTKRVVVNYKSCLSFTSNCLDHMKSVWALTHYLTFMNMMSKCDEFAQFNGSHDEYIMEEAELKAINSCLHAKNIDDCAAVCRNQMGFNSKLNFEQQAVEKVMGFLRNIDKEFGVIAKNKRIENDKINEARNKKIVEDEKKKSDEEKKKKEEEEKKAAEEAKKNNQPTPKLRLLEIESQQYNEMMDKEDETLKIILGLFDKETDHSRLLQGSKEPTEQEKNRFRTSQVEELRVSVKATGLDLASYTDKGADRYESLNLQLIFGKANFLMLNVIGALLLTMGIN